MPKKMKKLFSEVMGDPWYWEAMPAETYMRMVSDPGFLGDPLVKTQHLLGATQWEQLSETEVIGHHQLRAAHNRSTGLTLQCVDRRGHGHPTNEHFYKRINGTWKFAGLRPTVSWNEYDFEHTFKGIKCEDYAPKTSKNEAEKPSACTTKNGENEVNGVKTEMSDVNGTTNDSNGKYLDFLV